MNDLLAKPLLTLQDIADLHQCEIRHARDVLVKLPGFPEQAPTSTPRHRLWVTQEVRDFVNRVSRQPA